MIVGVVAFSICGCKPSYDASGTEAPTRPTAPAAIDTQVRNIAEGFTKLLQSGNFSKASSFFSSDLQKKMSVTQLTQETKSGSLKPLVSAGPLQFQAVQMNDKGNKATLRLAFEASEKQKYRMNFVVKQIGSDWKIDTIVPPTKHRAPAAAQGATSDMK